MMNSIAIFGAKVVHKLSHVLVFSRKLCDFGYRGDEDNNGFHHVEEPLKRTWIDFDSDDVVEGNAVAERNVLLRRSFIENVKVDARSILKILRHDGPGFDTKSALSELNVRLSGLLVRDVLAGVLKNLKYINKTRCAKLGYKFFVWSSQQNGYKHTTNSYHLMMKIFAECEEYGAMWRIVDEMVENGFPATSRTFNILICACGETGLARKVVEWFIKSKNFSYRPFKHSYNAILFSLLNLNQYKLIEWVYQQMLAEGFSPDTLTYNAVMCAKYRLGKSDQFYRLLEELDRSDFTPDLHTYNILLHVLGKADNPVAALDLLNHMKRKGFEPSVLHFTTLMDGLSRAKNLVACKHFFDEMRKNGCQPDVVSYTVLITGYVVVGELEKAKEMFDEMIFEGHLPNVFTYTSLIRGFCVAKKFEEACSMLKEMESRGCNPNFLLYSTLIGNLKRAGKNSEAEELMKQMVEKGKYVHLLPKIRQYRRC